MAISIQTIETKEFKLKPNGYDPDEVDEFLDSIIDEFEDMQREIQQLRAAARQKTAAPPPPQPTLEGSEAAQKLLVNAQRVSEETIADAHRQADTMIADARARAEKMLEDSRLEQARLEDSLETLRGAAKDYRSRFKRLVDDQMHLINGEKELFA